MGKIRAAAVGNARWRVHLREHLFTVYITDLRGLWQIPRHSRLRTDLVAERHVQPVRSVRTWQVERQGSSSTVVARAI